MELGQLELQLFNQTVLVLEPVVRLFQFGGDGGQAVADLGDEPHHVPSRQGGRLAGLGQLRLQLQKLPEVGVSPQGRVSRRPVQETLQRCPAPLYKLTMKDSLFRNYLLKFICNLVEGSWHHVAKFEFSPTGVATATN